MSTRLDELKQFLAESPQDPFLKYAITMELKKLGETEQALSGFEELVTHHADYVGTYYHYAKYLEELQRKDDALHIYQVGMELAQRLRNRHAYSELLGAYNLARGLDEDDWDE